MNKKKMFLLALFLIISTACTTKNAEIKTNHKDVSIKNKSDAVFVFTNEFQTSLNGIDFYWPIPNKSWNKIVSNKEDDCIIYENKSNKIYLLKNIDLKDCAGVNIYDENYYDYLKELNGNEIPYYLSNIFKKYLKVDYEEGFNENSNKIVYSSNKKKFYHTSGKAKINKQNVYYEAVFFQGNYNVPSICSLYSPTVFMIIYNDINDKNAVVNMVEEFQEKLFFNADE